MSQPVANVPGSGYPPPATRLLPLNDFTGQLQAAWEASECRRFHIWRYGFNHPKLSALEISPEDAPLWDAWRARAQLHPWSVTPDGDVAYAR